MNNTLLNTTYFLAKQFEKVIKGAKGEIIIKGLITTLVECIERSWKISFLVRWRRIQIYICQFFIEFYNGVNLVTIRLRFFPFFLRDGVWAWIQSITSIFITIWNELKTAFLTKYFRPSKTTQLRNKLLAWDKMMENHSSKHQNDSKKCMHHGLKNDSYNSYFLQ